MFGVSTYSVFYPVFMSLNFPAVCYSETGRILTTMQAGDFFGEIGILNLDGLNR